MVCSENVEKITVIPKVLMNAEQSWLNDWNASRKGKRVTGGEKGKRKLRCAQENHVMTRYRTTCLSFNAALDSRRHSCPVCLLERKAELKRQGVWMWGREMVEWAQRGQMCILTQLKADIELTSVDQPKNTEANVTVSVQSVCPQFTVWFSY